GDAMDLSLPGATLQAEDTLLGRTVGAAAALLGVTALDVACARRLGRPDEGDVCPRFTGVRVEEAVTINRPVDEVYQFWRSFQNFPRFMRHLESVDALGDRRSRWRAKSPAGSSVEWYAELIEERENEWIAWRSVDGSCVDNSGSVRFREAPGRSRNRPGGHGDDEHVGGHHRHRMDENAVREPEDRRDHLHPFQRLGASAEVRAEKHRRRHPSDPFGRRSRHSAASTRAIASRIVTRSVRAFSHSCSVKPFDSKTDRMSPARQPSTCSRIGTTIENASSLSTVLLAMRASCVFSETAIVNPSRLFTCSITWTSELPSPT